MSLSDKYKTFVDLRVTSWMIIAVLITAGCNSASPPEPIPSGMITQRSMTERIITENSENSISGAMDVPISRLDGTTFKLTDYKGKVVLVDFWATYCPPCVKQAPELAKLSSRYRDRGLEIIGLTSDEKSDQAKVEEFMARVGINYTIGYSGNWVSNSFLRGTEDETGAPPIPQLFVLSRDGRVIEHMIGDSPERGIEYLEKIIVEQLSRNSSAQ